MDLNSNELQEKNFINGITRLTGIPELKLIEYASGNNIFNVLEHPITIAPDKQQMEKILALNEFMVSYRILKLAEESKTITLSSVSAAGEYFLSLLSGVKDRERLIAVFLDGANNIIETKLIAEGKIDTVEVDPKHIVKAALYCDCVSIMLAHNHPTGGIVPSTMDKEITEVMVSILDLYNIKLLDHFIIGNIRYRSMRQESEIPNPSRKNSRYDLIHYGRKPSQKKQPKNLIASEPCVEEAGAYATPRKRNADKDFCR